MSSNKNSVSLLSFALSCIIHFLFLSTTIYILIICVNRGYSLTTLHVAFCTVGCFLLMTEAVLAVSGEAVLVAIVSKSNRITIHWVLHVLGLGLLAAGFGAMEASKIQNNFNHFTSDHGKVGLTACLVSWVVAIAAIPTVFTKILPRKLSLATIKLFHICFGIIAMILLLATQITGLYRPWWTSSELITNLILAAYVVGGFLLHVKPFYTWTLRVYELFT